MLCTAALLQACSKTDPAAVSPNLADAASIPAAKQAVEVKQVAQAPKADKATPLDAYQELSSGKTILFTYLSLSGMPVDYEKITGVLSSDYRYQSDEFKKRDILNAIKPSIDSELAKVKTSRYFFMDVSASLDKYDFASKSFAIQDIGDSSSYRYFSDASEYRLSFTNGEAFSKLPVADETKARSIESMRSQYQNMKIRFYFFTATTKLGETIVLGELTKTRLLDAKGNVLVEL